ncbi:hypothetical protein JGB54_23240, partial [Salmonella enterica subsp. enterica serovar Agona]|nr:hypothetical protein [Salmonella enterica subsp. enterica serovar Agona]
CVYLPPGIDVSLSALDGLVSHLPSPLLLLGDFNAHNPLWGGGCLDTMGRHVTDLLSSCQLCMFNTGTDTYFHQPTRTFSAIDLSLGSPSIFVDWSWAVLDDQRGSDHFPILLSYTGGWGTSHFPSSTLDFGSGLLGSLHLFCCDYP